ncbi:MAG: ArsB/NhaD family transporter [Chloroflexia bacterium]
MNLALVVGSLIFVVTLALIITRPNGLPEALAALGGGAAMLLLGIATMGQALGLLWDNLNVFGFFLGLMAISALADSAGAFEWLAGIAGRTAKGSARRLFVNVFLVGVLITVFLSNDATALILTPLVYALVTRLRLRPLPYMFACTFVADTASFVLPVSNPINIIVLQAFPADLGTYLAHLLPAALLVIAANIGLFLFIFRREIGGRFDTARLADTPPAHSALLRFSLIALALIGAAYVVAGRERWPLSLPALGGSVLLLAGARFFGSWEPRRWAREISWPIFGFIAGMLVVVQGVENIGLTGAFGRALLGMAGDSPAAAVALTAAGSAVGTNLLNNVPMALVMVSAIHAGGAAAPVHNALVYATILGADLGPNITVVGSLATMLWLLILRRKGLEVSAWDYFRLGISVTPLLIALGALAVWLGVR